MGRLLAKGRQSMHARFSAPREAGLRVSGTSSGRAHSYDGGRPYYAAGQSSASIFIAMHDNASQGGTDPIPASHEIPRLCQSIVNIVPIGSMI